MKLRTYTVNTCFVVLLIFFSLLMSYFLSIYELGSPASKTPTSVLNYVHCLL